MRVALIAWLKRIQRPSREPRCNGQRCVLRPCLRARLLQYERFADSLMIETNTGTAREKAGRGAPPWAVWKTKANYFALGEAVAAGLASLLTLGASVDFFLSSGFFISGVVPGFAGDPLGLATGVVTGDATGVATPTFV